MTITIESGFSFEAEDPVTVLLQFEAAIIPEQKLLSSRTELSSYENFARMPAQDGIGDRLWVRTQGTFEVSYTAQVEVERLLPELGGLRALDLHDLPGEVVPYLFDSRYCASERFQAFVGDEFGDRPGGDKINAMRDWIGRKLRYTPGASTADTTAVETFTMRRGVCRDYAHLMVTMARAAAIPARFVSCYGVGVTPEDFHAVAEVFLADETVPGGGAWHLVDATGMAEASRIVKIGVGRDAADVSFMTSFGITQFGGNRVKVRDEG